MLFYNLTHLPFFLKTFSLLDADVDLIPDEDDSVARNGLSFFHDNEVLKYSEWKYFKFEVGNYFPLYSLTSLLLVTEIACVRCVE